MSRQEWRVPIATLRRAGMRERQETRSAPINELRVAASSVPQGAEATADVRLESIEGGIEAVGHVFAPWKGECRRCLDPIDGTLDCEVREFFRPEPDEDGDEDAYPLAHEYADLEPMVTDALLLALPIAPLCRDDCRGLCPVCGAHLNDGECGCDRSPADPRWAGLDALRDPAARLPPEEDPA